MLFLLKNLILCEKNIVSIIVWLDIYC